MASSFALRCHGAASVTCCEAFQWLSTQKWLDRLADLQVPAGLTELGPSDDFHSIFFSVLAEKSRTQLLMDQVEPTVLSQRLGNSSFDLVFTSKVFS